MAKLARHNLSEVRGKGAESVRRVLADVRRKLDELRDNPDGFRGRRSVKQAGADIRADGLRRVAALERETASFLVEAYRDLDEDDEARRPTGEALAAQEAAWRRVEPLLAAGWKVGDLASLLARQGDSPGLEALRSRVPAILGKALGPDAIDSRMYREAVTDATAAIDDVAEHAGLVDSAVLEARTIRRGLDSVALMMDRHVRAARRELVGAQSMGEVAAARIEAGVAELGDQLDRRGLRLAAMDRARTDRPTSDATVGEQSAV
jgi:hypothetical protein